jgi:phage FluMu protein Com
MPKVQMVDPKKVKKEPKEVKKDVTPDFRKYLNIYEFDVKLPSGVKLKIKPINAGQLKKFMTSIKTETVKELSEAMYEMISSSIVNEDFDIGDVFLNDRPALILELRKVSKGSEFQFEYKCPKCKSQSLITEDLNNSKIIKMPKKINPIVKLDDNLSVRMDFVKIKDEQAILDFGLKTEAELLLSIIAISVKSIITPEGEQDDLPLADKIYFTDNIPQPMYEKLTQWHDQFHFGVDMKRKIKCVHCKEESDFTLDADNFFF